MVIYDLRFIKKKKKKERKWEKYIFKLTWMNNVMWKPGLFLHVSFLHCVDEIIYSL